MDNNARHGKQFTYGTDKPTYASSAADTFVHHPIPKFDVKSKENAKYVRESHFLIGTDGDYK